MDGGPDPGRGKIDLAWVGPGIGDEFRNGLGWKCRIDFHDIRHAKHARDRRDVANKIEIELVIERWTYHLRRTDPKQRVAVRWRTNRRLDADIAPGPRTVLNDECLAQTF